MTIYYVTTGAWGSGTGAPLAAAQVDGNFYDVDQRVVNLAADLAEGKRIDTVTYTDSSMTFHYTDATTQTIPLPIATLHYTGSWVSNTPYVRGNLFTEGNGFYQVLEDHTSAATFDPNATDGSTANNPLYELWMPLADVSYDAAIFVPGSIERAADELLWQGVTNKAMSLAAGSEFANAYLDIGNDGTGATDIILSIEKNRTEIGTVIFDGGGPVDGAGGQVGIVSIPSDVTFALDDLYGIRVTSSNNSQPSGLSVTLPFIRIT